MIYSTEMNVKISTAKACFPLNKMGVILKFDITGHLRKRFFRSTVETGLIYDGTVWTLIKHLNLMEPIFGCLELYLTSIVYNAHLNHISMGTSLIFPQSYANVK